VSAGYGAPHQAEEHGGEGKKRNERGKATMTLFELGILLTTAGVSGVGCAALCGAVLDRIGRPVPQAVNVTRTQQPARS